MAAFRARALCSLAVSLLFTCNLAWPADTDGKHATMDSAAVARQIDVAVQKRLELERISCSPLADDAEFLRRVYLDITGIIPEPDKAAAFLDDKDPDKRARLIDRL